MAIVFSLIYVQNNLSLHLTPSEFKHKFEKSLVKFELDCVNDVFNTRQVYRM